MEAQEVWRSYATICRLCLQKDGFMLGIFNHIQGKDKSIYKKIIDCTALQISFGDGLPNVICHRCLYKIEFCLEFRQLCFMSDSTLRQMNLNAALALNNNKESETMTQQPPLPIYEQLNGNEENVVMVVDPTALDYNSDYESDEKSDQNEAGAEAQADGTAAGSQMANNNADTIDNTSCDMYRNVCMCRYCDQAFTEKQDCIEHEQNAHNSAVPYNCAECSMDFADRLQYSAHLKSVHQNEKPYNCPLCDRSFARRSDLRKHTVVHTGIKPFTCTICFKSFSRNTNLSKHMKIHTSGKKPFICSQCPKTFIYKADLLRHAMIHNTTNKRYTCNYCKMGFSKKDRLLRHEKTHFPYNTQDKSQELQQMRETIYNNGNETRVKEENVDQSTAGGPGGNTEEKMVINLDPFNHNNFNDTSGGGGIEMGGQENGRDLPPIPEHITGDFLDDKDNIKKKFSCPTCNKKFSSPDNLRYHQAIHSGIRPFNCTLCMKSFIRKRELDRHIATHTGIKPFKCSKCPKSFGRKDKLARHMRIHDISNSEFTCHVCKGVFHKRDMFRHMRMHDRAKEEMEQDQPPELEAELISYNDPDIV